MPTGEENVFGLHQFDYKTSFFGGEPILSQGIGYAVVVGYGALFVVLTGLLSFLERRYGDTEDNSEEFNTAGRSLKSGLVAVDLVSRWTWVATLTVSVNQAYDYGVSGPLWYSIASAVQLIIFGVLALELKRKAPKTHTIVELIRLRWGHPTAIVFLYCCYLNNIMIAALLFVGAGAVMTAVTGINIYAALILLPLGVLIYTYGGGLKATFTSSYLHTIVIFVTINIFFFVIFTSNHDPVGSISDVYNNLRVMGEVRPVKDNKEGSYLTMYSLTGLKFGLFQFFAAFGNLFADQGYWQGAIASNPRAAYKGYILGGLLFFPVPLAFASALGLGTLAADLPVSSDEYGAGLICVAAAQFFMGKAGVVLFVSMVFMSVTSSGSAQFMAMSSLFTYDIYKAYIRPNATDKEMLVVSRASVCGFGALIGLISCFCIKVGFDVNFLFYVSGILMASAYLPISACILWGKVPAGAAIASALGGQVCSVIVWMCHTWFTYKRLTTKDTLARLGPTLSGTLAGTGSSLIFLVLWTLIKPAKDNYLAKFQGIELMDGVVVPNSELEETKMHPWLNKYSLFATVLSLVLFIAWPLLVLPADIFSEGYFYFWIILAAIWMIVATVVGIFLPLLEARSTLTTIVKNMLGVQSRRLSAIGPSPTEKESPSRAENVR